MSLRESLLPWGSQPQEAVQLDARHSNAWCVLPSVSQRDLVFDVAPSVTTGVEPSQRGIAAKDTAIVTYTNAAKIGANGPKVTLIIVTNQQAAGVRDDIISISNANSPFQQITIAANANTSGGTVSGSLAAFSYNGGFLSTVAGTGLITGNWQTVLVTVRGDGSVHLFTEAGKVGAGATSGTSWYSSSSLIRMVRGRQFFSLAAILGNDFTDEEALVHVRNPWQIFAPRRIWVPVSAASGPPTLAAIAASNLTASGARLTVTV